MNKKAQSNWIYLIVGVIAVLALVWYFGGVELKQKPKAADMTEEEAGTPWIEMRDAEGNEGEMLEDFYKVLGVVGSMIRGTTSVTCSINQDCLDKCGGDPFCLDHIQCYESKCTYGPGASGIPVTELKLKAIGKNTESSDLEVTLDSVTDNDVSTSVFEDSFSAVVTTTKLVTGGQEGIFTGEFFSIAAYEGKTTTFTINMHAVDTFSGERFPGAGSIPSSVDLVINADPIGGFSVQISQLPGLV